MPQKKGLPIATVVITGFIIHAAGTEKSLIQGATDLLTMPVGEMILDGSIIMNILSAVLLIAVVDAGLRLAPVLAPLLQRSAIKHLELDEEPENEQDEPERTAKRRERT